MAKYQLTLFVTGKTIRTEQALRSLKKIFTEHLDEEEFVLEVIDVLEEPERAEEEKILATPTLVKKEPPPRKRLVGDLDNIEEVKNHLDLVHK